MRPKSTVPPTLADVASACSVSLATVSKALSPHADRCDLNPATRERIVAMAQQLGWSRNRRRSARARRQWHNIGVLWGYKVPQFVSYEHVGDALAGILGERFRVLITPVPEANDWRELQGSLRLDGVIVLGQVREAIIADLEAKQYPAVLVNMETDRQLHQILVNDVEGTTALTAHLLGLGHRRIVYLRNEWEPGHYSERDRLAAVRQTVAAAGAHLDEVRGRLFDDVVAHCRAGATAVICHNYSDVADMRSALREAGLAVPRDVSLGGCHELSWFRHMDPPITSVAIPLREMAEVGARLLLELMSGRGEDAPLRQVLPETLTVRASTGLVCVRKA